MGLDTMPPFPHLFHLTSPPSSPTTKTEKETSPSTRGLMNSLPNELILAILLYLPLGDILTLTLIHHRSLHPLCLKILSTILSQPKRARLRFFFDQESRWRSAIDMVLVSSSSTKFVFRPVHTDLSFRAYSSLVLRRPSLIRIAIIDYTNNISVVENLLSQSASVDIKHIEPSILAIDTRSVGAFFHYRVHATPPNRVKQRPGERWMQPIEFSCHPRWIFQRKTYLIRLFELIPCWAGLLLSHSQHHNHHHHYATIMNRFIAKSQNVPIIGHGVVSTSKSKSTSQASSSTAYLGIGAPS